MTRFVDPGAIFAGWVGLGTAVVVVVAFALVFPIQPLVYLLALPTGALIGWYANMRAGRWRPRRRVVLNALWAGTVTAVTLAAFYLAIRLLFMYADSGYPDFNRVDPVTREPVAPFCATGPDCTYQRHLAADLEEQLTAAGVSDAASFERYFLAQQLGVAGLLVVLTLAGAGIAAGWRAWSGAPHGTRPEAD